MQKPDYIIVGAGPAGCVLANRLTEDSGTTVLLIEAGGSDDKLIVQMPAAVPFAYQDKELNWGYMSGPEPYLKDRYIDEKRGRVMGGSSSINAMIFNRGNEGDFAAWEKLGAVGWGWHDCLPYFMRMETYLEGSSPLRGDSGPLKISRCKAKFPIYQDFLKSGQNAGFKFNRDHNSHSQDGMHIAQAYIGHGRRSNSVSAYLKPILHRKNLVVRTQTQVIRVLLKGLKAVGIEVFHNGETKTIYCQKEVILAAGAFASPQILMLSGIGDPDELKALGIEVKYALPEVGKNLENHPGVNLEFDTDEKDSLISCLKLVGKAKLAVNWGLNKNGLGATNFFEVGAFLPTRDDVDYPNVQIEFLPFRRKIVHGKLVAIAGCNFFVGLARPLSRGFVKLKNSDPFEAPQIVFNHLQEKQDLEDLLDGVELIRKIANQKPIANKLKGEISPGAHLSRAEMEDWVASAVGTSYHPSGTCRMGTDDNAVVNTSGMVNGIEGLRVVDASIMPKTVTGNISATVYMLAEKMSDVIRGRQQLKPVVMEQVV